MLISKGKLHIVLREKISEDAGTIEPALVLIPLMILMLSTLQIASGVYARVSATNLSQAALYSQALFVGGDSSSGVPANSSADTGSLEVNRVPLPGGGSLLAGTASTTLPSTTPLLPGGDTFVTHSLAVSEGP